MKRYIKADSYTFTIQDINQKIEDFLETYMKFVNYDNVGDLWRNIIPDAPDVEEEPDWSVDVQPYNDNQVIVNIHAEIERTEDMQYLVDKLNEIVGEFDDTSYFTIRDPFDLFAIINI